MDYTFTLQTILGVDKKNPVFTLARDDHDPARIHVFFGAEPLETIPWDRHNPAFKLLLGRLFNAGISRKALRQTFGVCHTTQARWGKALLDQDPQNLLRVLAGSGAPRKLTPQVRSFVQTIYPAVQAQERRRPSALIREQIEKVFGVQISGETLRPLLRELKAQSLAQVAAAEAPQAAGAKVAPPCACAAPPPPASPPVPQAKASCHNPSRPGLPEPEETGQRKLALLSTPPSTRDEDALAPGAGPLSHHGGVLLFALMLATVVERLGAAMTQWVASILLGATVIEQSKLLDGVGLKALLGEWIFSPGKQRETLRQLATTAHVEQVYQLNLELLEARKERDFYYDPHTKQYTGAEQILKGWCGKLHDVAKVLHLDFIHTTDGDPVLQIPFDNFEDLRQRFPKVTARLRALLKLADEEPLTIIADRGLFKAELLQAAAATHNHLIMWEKGYSPAPWPEKAGCKGCFMMERPRNNSRDRRTYRFEFIDRAWPKDCAIRQILVRATNPKGRTIEVSILATDPRRPAPRIVELIFKRWIQENDFKDLDLHFGMLAITSYGATSYERIREVVEDHQCQSGQLKGLELLRRGQEEHLSRLLLHEHLGRRPSAKRQERIQACTTQLRELAEKIRKVEKEASRLQSVIQDGYVRLNTEAKALMDALKILARNIYRRLLLRFRPLYDNLRDDHVILRNLIAAPAFIKIDAREVRVQLHPSMPYPPALRTIVQELLDQLNRQQPPFPADPAKTISLTLSPKKSKRQADG